MSLTEEQKQKMAEGRKRAAEARKREPQQQSFDQLVQAFKAALDASKASEEEKERKLIEILSPRRPENAKAPLVSSFNPLGDRDNPRPALKCAKVFQCGFPIMPKQATYEELELINELIDMINDCHTTGKPIPEFMISKADGNQARVQLECKFNGTTAMLEELKINYPVRTIDMRSGLYSFTCMLQEMLGKDQPEVDVSALQSRMRSLEAENQQLKLALR